MEKHDCKQILPSPPITVLNIKSSYFKSLIYIQELAFGLWEFRPWILHIKDCAPRVLPLHRRLTLLSKYSKHPKPSSHNLEPRTTHP